MTRIDWTPQLELGHPEIDRQHRNLVAVINRLRDEIDDGRDENVLAVLADELIRFAEDHFATEERLMDGAAYAYADTHRAEHRSMLDDIRRVGDACVTSIGDPTALLHGLENWFLSHLHDADRKLGAALAGESA